MTNPLFRPLDIGAIQVPNRVLMAPLTRSRARQPGDVPWGLNTTYYRQRASAGFIVTEATCVSPLGRGYALIPGIYTEDQEAGWRAIVDGVHDAGGRILMQVWHSGRVSHMDLLPDSQAPVAPSALRAKAQTYVSATSGMVDVSEPRALETGEIPTVIDEFRQAATRAKAAGFDGVEIHGANGYLLDEFTRDGSNLRTDEYGGSIANRIRFPLAVVDAVTDVFDANRVGYRVSPAGAFNDMSDSSPVETFSTLASELSSRGLAFIHVFESDPENARDEETAQSIRAAFDGVYIANGGYTAESGSERIESGNADAIAYGTLFLANPDLPRRFQEGAPLNEADPSTFYGGTEKGYTDYPFLD